MISLRHADFRGCSLSDGELRAPVARVSNHYETLSDDETLSRNRALTSDGIVPTIWDIGDSDRNASIHDIEVLGERIVCDSP